MNSADMADLRNARATSAHESNELRGSRYSHRAHPPLFRLILIIMVSLTSIALWSLVGQTASVRAWTPLSPRQGQQGADGAAPGGAGGGGGGGAPAPASSDGSASSVTSSATASASSAAAESSAITSTSSSSAAPSIVASTTTDATGGVTVYLTSISTVTASGTCAPVPTDTLIPGTTIPDGYTSPQIPYPLVADSEYYVQNPKWANAHSRARDYLSGWSVEEKSRLCTGVGWSFGRCVGNIEANPARNFSGLCLQDSPLGVRFADRVSAFPAGVNVASTFDKDLMYARGYAMGAEFKAKGVNIALGPSIDMARNAAGGRIWEAFGGDPYLTGWAAEMTIKGMQDAGVQAT